jgi:DNA primase
VIRERVDPVTLVEGLTKAKVKSRSPGDVRLAPCPFCGSKTGFSVNPQTKTYCCHHAGCGEQGDVFTFVKRVKGFAGNWDALKFLVERVGYELPRARALEGDHLAAILNLAQDVKRAAVDYYAGRLWDCRDERLAYTRDGKEHETTVLGYQAETRGHSEDILRWARVGWADGKLLAHLKERYREHPDRKLAFAAMMASGLVKKTERGFRDLFRPGGYVYPVFDDKRVLTFTAKYPDDGIPNYQLPRTVEINGHEILAWGSPFYFLNHDALGAEDLYLVEGEDGVLTVMDLGGHESVCGLRGTPNKEQLAALAERRRGKRTFLVFDNDEAGRDLTWKLWEILARSDCDLRVVTWPDATQHESNTEEVCSSSGAKRGCPRMEDIDDVLRSVGRESAPAYLKGLAAKTNPASSTNPKRSRWSKSITNSCGRSSTSTWPS